MHERMHCGGKIFYKPHPVNGKNFIVTIWISWPSSACCPHWPAYSRMEPIDNEFVVALTVTVGISCLLCAGTNEKKEAKYESGRVVYVSHSNLFPFA